MNYEKKYKLMQRQNDELKKQLDDVRLKLIEKEDELNADELRQEYLDMLEIFYKAIDGIKETQREYHELMHEAMTVRNEFEKEVRNLKKEFGLLNR